MYSRSAMEGLLCPSPYIMTIRSSLKALYEYRWIIMTTAFVDIVLFQTTRVQNVCLLLLDHDSQLIVFSEH